MRLKLNEFWRILLNSQRKKKRKTFKNDENVFVYLLNIYIFLQNKKNMKTKLTSLQGFEKERKKPSTNRDYSTCVLLCTRLFFSPFKLF